MKVRLEASLLELSYVHMFSSKGVFEYCSNLGSRLTGTKSLVILVSTLNYCSFFSKGGFDYCSKLGGVLASPSFFDLYNIGETPRTTANMPNDTSSIDKESNSILLSHEKIATLGGIFLHVSKSQYFFSNLNSNCSNLLDMRNLQEQVKKAFC